MAAHENLVGGGKADAALLGAAPDLSHAVKAGGQHHHHRARHRLHHHGPAAALEAVEAHDGQLAQRGLEEEDEDEGHLGREKAEEELDHG